MSFLSSTPKNEINDAETFYPLGGLGRREQVRRVHALLTDKTNTLTASEEDNARLTKELQVSAMSCISI